MKAKRSAGVFLSAAVLFSGIFSSTVECSMIDTFTQATTSEIQITPFWVYVYSVSADINASGTTLTPSVFVQAFNPSSYITGTLYLEKYVNGTWSTVTSWSVSGTGSLSVSKSYTGAAGSTYRSRIKANVSSEAVEYTSTSVTL